MMTADIKFACLHCGQNILVRADAAGLQAACPTCAQSVTIPVQGSFGEPSGKARNGRKPGAEAGEELAVSRAENARLREQFSVLQAENERLNASNTNAQA